MATCDRCGRGIERDLVLVDTVPSNPPQSRRAMHAFCAAEHFQAELLDYQHDWALWFEKWKAALDLVKG